jgi:hypothetical protein
MRPSTAVRRIACHLGTAVRRGLVIASIGGATLVLAVGAAHAEPAPGDSRPHPYPELRYFTQIDAAPYISPGGQGAWFVTAQGLNCGIWFRGSFGCVGPIPGAPGGVDKIGWITGDTRVHYDWTMAVRFPPPAGALTIPPLSYIESEGTSCGTALDGSTYCERGPWRLLITPTRTWLNG